MFLSDEDRVAWLETLAEVCKRFNWMCHADCQMTNHYHVLVETPDANLSKGMRQLNGVYTAGVRCAANQRSDLENCKVLKAAGVKVELTPRPAR